MRVTSSLRARRWALPVTALNLAATVATVVGLVLFGVMLSEPRVRSVGPGEPVTLSGLSVVVGNAGWVGHDMSAMGGMPMGAPGDTPTEGTTRLQVQLSLASTGEATEVAVSDFRLQAGSGRSWKPQRATMAAVTAVPPSGALVGDLYFEVPDGESSLRLAVDRGQSRALLALDLPGAGPEPAHGGSGHGEDGR